MIITVDATHHSADVTLSLWSGGGTFTDVPPLSTMTPTNFGFYNFDIASNEYQGVIADSTFWGNMTGRYFYSFSVFRADFTHPTDFVDIFGGGFGQGDPLYAYAYNSHGKIVGEHICNVPMIRDGETCNLTFTGTDISFVTAGGSWAGQIVSSMTFDDLSVNEPGTLGLLGLGLVVILITARFNRRER